MNIRRRNVGRAHTGRGVAQAALIAVALIVVGVSLGRGAFIGGSAEARQTSSAVQSHDLKRKSQAEPEVESSSRIVEAATGSGLAGGPDTLGPWYAEADWWVVVFTGLLFVATFGLWIFTALLWRSTQASIEHARVSSQKELRAYIAVSPVGVAQLIGRTTVIGQVDVRNIGKLPARNVSVVVRMETGTREMNEFAFDCDSPEPRVLQPGEAMRQGSKQPYLCHTAITQAKKEHVFVWGVVWYDDGYGERRFTRFCHRYSAASYNRDHVWSREAKRTRLILEPDKARLHNLGNDAT